MRDSDGPVVVLISKYGESPYFGAQLKSLARQTVIPEVLIRDDGGAGAEHLGIEGSYGRLLSQVPVASSYVAFCDQDDVWFRRKIEVLLCAMKKAEAQHPGPVLVHADAVVTDESLKVLKGRFISKWARHDDFYGTLMFNKVQGASMLINRPLLEIIKDLPGHGPMYDRYIHLVAEIFGRRIFIDRPLMYYRQHGNNAIGALQTRSRANLSFLSEDDRILYPINKSIIERFTSALDANKRRAYRDYQRLLTTRNPALRLILIFRYLWRYPGTLVKKLAKVWLP